MYEATKEADTGTKENHGGSRAGVEVLDGRRRGQAVFTYRKQEIRPEKNIGQGYSEQELRELLKEAYSIESRAGHGKELLELPLERLGLLSTAYPDRFIELWKDSEENYWYQTKFLVDNELISDTEYIFGHGKRSK